VKLAPILGWALLIGGVISLSQARTHLSQAPAQAVTGQQLTTPITTKIQVNATVRGVVVKHTGQAQLDLQADDGTSLTLMVPPTVSVRLPAAGERIAVAAKQIQPKMLQLDHQEDLKREAMYWHADTKPEIVSNPRHAKTGQRVRTLAYLSVGPMHPSNVYIGHLTQNGQHLVAAMLPRKVAQQAPDFQDRELLITGYLTDDHMFVIEALQVPILD